MNNLNLPESILKRITEIIDYHSLHATHVITRDICEQIASELYADLMEAREALSSIAAEKCEPDFDSVIHKLERGNLISIIDTDTAIAREALSKLDEKYPEKEKT